MWGLGPGMEPCRRNVYGRFRRTVSTTYGDVLNIVRSLPEGRYAAMCKPTPDWQRSDASKTIFLRLSWPHWGHCVGANPH
jgi:hypothetical protein